MVASVLFASFGQDHKYHCTGSPAEIQFSVQSNIHWASDYRGMEISRHKLPHVKFGTTTLPRGSLQVTNSTTNLQGLREHVLQLVEDHA